MWIGGIPLLDILNTIIVVVVRKWSTEVHFSCVPWSLWCFCHLRQFCVMRVGGHLTFETGLYSVLNTVDQSRKPVFPPDQVFGLGYAQVFLLVSYPDNLLSDRLRRYDSVSP